MYGRLRPRHCKIHPVDFPLNADPEKSFTIPGKHPQEDMRIISLLPLLILTVVLSMCGKKEQGWDVKDYGGAAPVISKPIVVYRGENCGCCKHWIAHLQKHGFVVEDHVSTDMTAVKKKYGVGEDLASCHTAVVDGYVIEGHVPAQDIVQLLAKKPKEISGLSVPEMPVGTPGMEDAEHGRKDAFNVISFSKEGAQVYRRYEKY